MENITRLLKLYKTKKTEIEKRLKKFKRVWNKNDEYIFSELCFCILTPQSKAEVCDGIIRELKNKKLLYKGSIKQIMPYLTRARFYKHKSEYIISARNLFSKNNKLSIKNKLDVKDIRKTRQWLVENVKGIGYKEASHFLRNIGWGDNLAILDVHILRNLKRLGIIKDIPKSISRKMYLETEKKLEKFSHKIKIPMAHLDLLFWCAETNKIFK